MGVSMMLSRANNDQPIEECSRTTSRTTGRVDPRSGLVETGLVSAPEIVIDERFCGPPDSANGGYTCGLLAGFLNGPAQVTLRSPPPLGRPLRVQTRSETRVELFDGEHLVADAVSTAVDRAVPPPATLPQARLGAASYEWADVEVHPYPRCFVCGPARSAGDGMRVFPGPLSDRDIYAAPWRPDDSLLGADGRVAPEFLWAALDCPSGLVTNRFAPNGRILLGRLAVDVLDPVPGETEYILTSWAADRDGRKMSTGSALFSEGGHLHAVARAVWIEVAG